MSGWGTTLHISVGKKLQIHNELAEFIFVKSYLSGCPHQSKHVRSAGGGKGAAETVLSFSEALLLELSCGVDVCVWGGGVGCIFKPCFHQLSH